MKIMKLTSMKNFVFLSGLKHTHKSDVRGPSLENHFLVSKVAWMMGTAYLSFATINTSQDSISSMQKMMTPSSQKSSH